LDFSAEARRAFAFLVAQGFVVEEASPTLIRYRKGEVAVAVYHGRRSYELGLEVSRGEETHSLAELIKLVDTAAAKNYRSWTATTTASVANGLDILSALAQRYGEQVLSGDPQSFMKLKAQQQAWSSEFALDVLAGQLRPQAHAAFRNGEYAEASELFERIEPRLSPVELQKLRVAQRRRGLRS